MSCDEEDKPSRKRPSDFQLSIGSIIGVLSLAASGVAAYSTIQADIAGLKRDMVHQERATERISDENQQARREQRGTMREFNEKLDRIIEHWPDRRR